MNDAKVVPVPMPHQDAALVPLLVLSLPGFGLVKKIPLLLDPPTIVINDLLEGPRLLPVFIETLFDHLPFLAIEIPIECGERVVVIGDVMRITIAIGVVQGDLVLPTFSCRVVPLADVV